MIPLALFLLSLFLANPALAQDTKLLAQAKQEGKVSSNLTCALSERKAGKSQYDLVINSAGPMEIMLADAAGGRREAPDCSHG